MVASAEWFAAQKATAPADTPNPHFPGTKAVKKRGAVSSLRLGYLQSSDDYKSSSSDSERAEEEAARSKRLGADRLSAPIPLFLRTLGKATRYRSPVNGRGGGAARNLAEMRRSKCQTRQHRGSAAPQTSLRGCKQAEKKALRHRAGRETALSDSAVQAEVRGASERAGAATLAGKMLPSRENLSSYGGSN